MGYVTTRKNGALKLDLKVLIIPSCKIKNGVSLPKLLFPVVLDVLDVVIIFHDVDELFHSKPSASGGYQGKHWENTTL